MQSLNAITGNIARKGGLYYHPGAINNMEFVHKFTKDKNDSDSRIGGFPQIFGGPPASVFAQDVLSDDPNRSYDSSQVIARETPGYNVNHLHSDSALDRFTRMPIFNGTPCTISLCCEPYNSVYPIASSV